MNTEEVKSGAATVRRPVPGSDIDFPINVVWREEKCKLSCCVELPPERPGYKMGLPIARREE